MHTKKGFMVRDQILIVTQKFDPHADYIIQMLNEAGHEVTRLNSDDIPLSTVFNLRVGSSDPLHGTIAITTNKRGFDIERVRSIWWRKPDQFSYIEGLTEDEDHFMKTEVNHMVQGLWESLSDCYWMSHPHHIRRAGWKVEQLERAQRMGFEIPRSIVTNDPEAVRGFYEECHQRIVYKTLYGSFLASKNRNVHDPLYSYKQPLQLGGFCISPRKGIFEII